MVFFDMRRRSSGRLRGQRLKCLHLLMLFEGKLRDLLEEIQVFYLRILPSLPFLDS